MNTATIQPVEWDINTQGDLERAFARFKNDFFSPSNMEGFKTQLPQIEHTKAGGVCLFIRSDKRDREQRGYTLVSFNCSTGELLRLSDFQRYWRLRDARLAMRKWKRANQPPAGYEWAKFY